MTLTDQINAILAKKASSPAQRAVNAGAPNATENPTDAQKAVGNYRKVHLNIDGFRISIENPKGSVRSGTSPDGTKWSNVLACDYGDIRGTESVDGDPVDIYLSDHPEKGAVFVIDQIDPKTGKFDEHKVMYGFNSVEDATKTYLACYQKGWKGLGWITPVSKAEFRKWIDSSTRKTKPFHEYKSVNPIIDPVDFNKKAAFINIGDSVKQAAWYPIIVNTLGFPKKKDDREKISPDADTRHFFDKIVPYIKFHSDTAGIPSVDYNVSKFFPGFYHSVDIRKQPLKEGFGGFSYPNGKVEMYPRANSSDLVHELKHQQNQDGFSSGILRNKPSQSGRSAEDDRLLSEAYKFIADDVRPFYPSSDDERLKRYVKAEQGATHAQHQFTIMRELKNKLGRNPTGEEFVDYVRNADVETLDSWRAYLANGYQARADLRNIRYSHYLRKAEAEAKKFDFPRYIDYAPKSEMDKYKKQPWYDPDIFRRSSDDGDPFDKTTESGIRGGFNPRSMWIDGRSKQMREQNHKQVLESYRKALMNVAKNNVRQGELYQNTQNAWRGMLV